MSRTVAHIKRELQRLKQRVESAQEAEGRIEELECELAQETAVLFLLVSERFVPEDTDVKPNPWTYETMGVSEETAFIKLNMRFQAKNGSIQIRFYDQDDLILTTLINPNERVRMTVPFFRDPGEYEFMINAFKTKKEAEECMAVLELHQTNAAEIGLN